MTRFRLLQRERGVFLEDFVPDIDGDGLDDPAICFEVELINQTNQQTVGAATDCLSDLTPSPLPSPIRWIGVEWEGLERI